MSAIEIRTFAEKVIHSFYLANEKLIESIKKEDGELVISKNGKLVRIKARDLK